jgi:hypothetical protein
VRIACEHCPAIVWDGNAQNHTRNCQGLKRKRKRDEEGQGEPTSTKGSRVTGGVRAEGGEGVVVATAVRYKASEVPVALGEVVIAKMTEMQTHKTLPTLVVEPLFHASFSRLFPGCPMDDTIANLSGTTATDAIPPHLLKSYRHAVRLSLFASHNTGTASHNTQTK